MMKGTLNIFVLFFAPIFFSACKKTEQRLLPPQVSLNTKFPLPNAGSDQIIVLPGNSVLLDGSGSVDLDGYIVSYLWTQIYGPSQAVIANPAAAVTSITGFVEGVYNFKLQVTDNNGAVSYDVVEFKFIKNVSGFVYTFTQSWSSNDGAGADNDVYVTSASLPGLFLIPNISFEVFLRHDSSGAWISVPPDTSALAANSKYFYMSGREILFVYASYPGSYKQLIGKGVTVKVQFL